MGCARSKEKQSDLDKNISKKNRHKHQQQQQQTEQEKTPRLDHYESSIDIVVPETPMSPSSQETVDIRSEFKKSDQVLNLSEALERTRRQRDAFYSSLLSPPTSAKSNHSNPVNCLPNEQNSQTTPVTTSSMVSRSNIHNFIMQEQAISWLAKLNDCASQHKLNSSEFVMIQNHFVGLIDSVVNSIARFRLKSSKSNLLKIDYNEIKESIYYMRYSVEEFPSLLELSSKLEKTNKSLGEYLNETPDMLDSMTKYKLFQLIEQLNEINGKLPKEKFTCKCMKVSDETTNDLHLDDLDLIDIKKTKEVEVVKSHREDPSVLLDQLLNNLEIRTSKLVEKEAIKIEEEENSVDSDEDKGSTPILTPASGQSTLPSEKTTSTPSSLSLESPGDDEELSNTSADIKLKLEESKSADLTNESNINNTINQQIINQIVNEIFDETTAKANYTDDSINNNSSANENDQESEDAENVLSSSKVETNESDIQNENEIQVKLETNTSNDKSETNDQTKNKKQQKPNNKKKRNKRR